MEPVTEAVADNDKVDNEGAKEIMESVAGCTGDPEGGPFKRENETVFRRMELSVCCAIGATSRVVVFDNAISSGNVECKVVVFDDAIPSLDVCMAVPNRGIDPVSKAMLKTVFGSTVTCVGGDDILFLTALNELGSTLGSTTLAWDITRTVLLATRDRSGSDRPMRELLTGRDARRFPASG